jgi:hypothetical protein
METNIKLPDDWIYTDSEGLLKELVNEVAKDHELYKYITKNQLKIIARSTIQDDILVFVDGKYAYVHLTWSGKNENNPYPITIFYNSIIDFIHDQNL